MPDHAHLLVEGMTGRCSVLDFVHVWKRRTGYHAWESRRPQLWQRSFYDHVIRSDESAIAIAAYIMANPIRARLSSSLGEYPFAGSDVYSLQQLVDAMFDVPASVRRTRQRS
jgi:REP-associated tyrosine transposase